MRIEHGDAKPHSHTQRTHVYGWLIADGGGCAVVDHKYHTHAINAIRFFTPRADEDEDGASDGCSVGRIPIQLKPNQLILYMIIPCTLTCIRRAVIRMRRLFSFVAV